MQVPLTGSELASPSRRFTPAKANQKSPDPKAQITLDAKQLITARVVTVPSKARAGRTVRVHVTMTPSVTQKAHWNNEAEPLRLWVDPPKGWQASRRLISVKQPKKPESKESRLLDFEVKLPRNAKGKHTLKTYALCYVCEDSGLCYFLRQNINIAIEVE